MVPQLKQLDSKDVTHTERLEAFQELSSLLEEMKIAIENKLYQKQSIGKKAAVKNIGQSELDVVMTSPF